LIFLPNGAEAKISIREKTIKNEVVDAVIPIIEDDDHHDSAAKINKEITSDMLILPEEDDGAYLQDISRIKDRRKYMLSYVLNYQVRFNKNGFLCLTIGEYTYTGGAHGYYAISPQTIDMETGQMFKLDDLFKNPDKARKK
jgi:hypothetical protein